MILKNKNFHLIVLMIGFISTTFLNAQNVKWESKFKTQLSQMADSLTTHLQPWKVPQQIFKIEDFGAVNDTNVVNTAAIQKAINECSAKGGGVVLFSKGDYVTGTIELKSGVMLEIAKGARILGSTNLNDYPEKIEQFKSVNSEINKYCHSLIYAERCEKVGIRGKGEIYFRGEIKNFSGEETAQAIPGRPFGIRMIECNNVVLQDIYLHNSAGWMQNYLICTNLIFDGIKVVNQANFNNDGLDPDGCKNVIVRNCSISSGDDAMCFKGASNRPTENVLIENSNFMTSCNALKLGTDTQGAFRNIIARNLTLGGIPDSLPAIKGHQCSTGVTLATVDGGNVENIWISNISINRARCPIFMRIGSRLRVMPGSPQPEIGYLKNIVIENVNGENNFRQGSFITGIKDKSIENVTIRNLNLKMEGINDSTLSQRPVAEKEKGYPDAQNFSVDGLPAYGFFVRYANNVNFENVKITPDKLDARCPFLTGKNCTNCTMDGSKIPQQKEDESIRTTSYIENLKVNDVALEIRVKKYKSGSQLFTDLNKTVETIYPLFENAEYIYWPFNLKYSNAETFLSFEINNPGTVYIAHDPKFKQPEWLIHNFENTGSSYEVANMKFVLYKKEIIQPQKFILGGNQTGVPMVNDGANYLVFFVPGKK